MPMLHNAESIFGTLQGAAEAHIVSFVAEGEATEWGCDVVWVKSADERTAEENTRHLENCVAVFGIIFRLVDDEDVPTDDFFVTLETTASPFMDVSGEVLPHTDAR